MPIYRKSSEGGRKPSWTKLRHKKGSTQELEAGQMQQTQESYRDMVQVCRKKDKVHLELSLSR